MLGSYGPVIEQKTLDLEEDGLNPICEEFSHDWHIPPCYVNTGEEPG